MEFQYPESKIHSGKTFIYEDSLTKKQTFESLQFRNINGKKLKVSKSFDSNSISDSVIYFGNGITEHYNFFMNKNGSPVKGDMLQEKVTRNGHRLGIYSAQIRYITDDLIFTTTTKEEFLKDTIITWQSNQITSLVISTNSTIEIKVKADTILSHMIEVHSRLYYSKNVGLIRYSVQFTDHTGKDNYTLWKLARIDDMKN